MEGKKMKIPSFKKCPKGHKKQYYHNKGDEWCLWCPKCKKIFSDCQNFYRWPLLSKIDNFINYCFGLNTWENRIITLRWFLARHLVGHNAVGNLLIYRGDKLGYCPFCGGSCRPIKINRKKR